MKKVLFLIMVLLASAIGISCGSDSSSDSGEGTTLKNSFQEGWWKYDNSYTVAYIKYGSSRNIERCGNRDGEFFSTVLENARSLYRFDVKAINDNLTKVGD